MLKSIFPSTPSTLNHRGSKGIVKADHTNAHLAGEDWRERAMQLDTGQAKVLYSGAAEHRCFFCFEAEVR